MTSGWGHVLKSQGQNSMAGHVLCIFSYMSPWCPDSQSHVLSSNWNQKIVNQPNIPNLDLEVQFNSFVEEIVCKIFISGIAKPILILKYKKRGAQKRFALQTQKMHCKANLISVPLLIPSKIHFFNLSFFDKNNIKKLLCGQWYINFFIKRTCP